MKAEEVARYLHDHPEFFDQYAEMLTLVTIPDPHTGRAISITEKQLFTLRDKVRTLESKLAELIGFGEENDAISGKVHALGVALTAAADSAAVVRALYSHLGGAFAVPHVALRIWGAGSGTNHEFDAVSPATKVFASSLTRPFCGPSGGQESLTWPLSPCCASPHKESRCRRRKISSPNWRCSGVPARIRWTPIAAI
jgi:uncharacterized protein YigA (DUF484 family)